MPVYKNEQNGKWDALFYYEDWTGKRKQKHKRGFATKKEAKEYERQYILRAKADMDMTLESFVAVYFDDKKGELKERSIRNKRYMIQTHIVPYLGKKKMNEITPADIIAWQNKIKEEHEYSQAYLRMLQNQMTALFTHAFNIYNLANNPCKKVKKMGKSDDRSLTFWTYDEYKLFIDTFDKKGMHFVMFEILFWTGCREGELLALTMNDIDLSSHRLHINKTYYRHAGEDIITEPKTENSIRTVELPEFLVNEIKDYYMCLYNYPDDERLFPIGAKAVQNIMKRHAQKAGVKDIRVHDLRHSHVAYLIHQNIPPLIIKERLGHKDIKVTLNTYGHLYPDEQKKVANLLDELIKKNAPADGKDIQE